MSSKSPKRVLIVDDSALMLNMARDALEQAGFSVATAHDLGELEAEQERGLPDLILMDVRMPELYGDDVAMVLRNVREVKVPIYLWSSLDPEELAERAGEAEIDGYVCKRDGVDELVGKVREILASPSDGGASSET